MNLNYFYSPLSQFEILPILNLDFSLFDFTITNSTMILFIVVFVIVTLYFFLVDLKDYSFSININSWQIITGLIYNLIKGLAISNIGIVYGSAYLPLVFSIFLFVVFLNLIGLIPYSFTVTSHLIVTFCLSISIFIGINILAIQRHGSNFFSLFLPSGISFYLSFLLIPIELISYIFKPISLSIRLFANMMSGHTLLKVVAGFGYNLMGTKGIFFILHYFCLFILIPLFVLEIGVSLIQAFVFSVLVCIYIKDSIKLH